MLALKMFNDKKSNRTLLSQAVTPTSLHIQIVLSHPCTHTQPTPHIRRNARLYMITKCAASFPQYGTNVIPLALYDTLNSASN